MVTHLGATRDRGYHGYQQSLRSRRGPSRMSRDGPPHLDLASSEDEDPPSRTPQKLAMPMGIKKAVRQLQHMQVPVSSKRTRHSRALKHFYAEAKETLAILIPWRKAIHKIGGHFGGGVQSYFVFLRFLVVLNFLSFLLIAGFVLIPSVVLSSPNNTPSIPNGTNITGKELCMKYDHSPEVLPVFYTFFLDLLSGTGFMEYTYLFYGYYSNTVAESKGVSYNVPLAYLLTASFYFLFCLVCIILRMGNVVRVLVTTGSGGERGYSARVFTDWDYGLQGDRATGLKQNTIRYRLQVDLEEDRIRLRAASLSPGQTVGLYALRALLNLVVIALIIAAFFGIAEATSFSQREAVKWTGVVGLLLEFLPSIVITASNFVVPFLCDQIARLEKLSPSTTVIVALLRAVFLRLVSLGVLLFTLWSQITCSGKADDTDCKICRYNSAQYQCWESRVGQEMYKLTLFDFLTTMVLLVLVEFPRRLLVDHCSCKLTRWVGRQEFLVPPNVLALVYGQTVVWTGALFCPLLPLINTIKFFIIFHCKKATLFQNCRPAIKSFRSTSSNFFFCLVLLFGWILSTVVLIYSMAEIHPSFGCGPFRFSPTMWSVIQASIDNLTKTTQDFFNIIGSLAFCVPLFLLSCVVLSYVAALASVYGKSVAILREQIKQDGRDKQFLVKQIKDLTRILGVPKHEEDQYDPGASWGDHHASASPPQYLPNVHSFPSASHY
ncbi:transmembrane channel-like protein 4 isoform X2 [Denticeps clupeoides]|uniref:Transmembrane channel-like protein n=1 Tax=Denticeps clupeoides TaxID=299321 RepID=A0AAY4ARJ3_9TELE|nr:transmembrane channel-like protein 4 isoform X2 [Denticeps clupeoides]